MISLSEEKKSKIIEAFSSTSRYLDDLLKIDFDGLICQTYPSELLLIKKMLLKQNPRFWICVCLF